MPLSFTGFSGWVLLLMLGVGIVQHLLSRTKTTRQSQ